MSAIFSEGYFVLFLIITLGLAIGRLRIRGFSLDLSAVIFVALLLGHLGLVVPPAFQTIGLLFFVFTIGLQAGPGFFEGFRKVGRDLLVLCVALVSSAALLTWVLGSLLGIEPFLGVGLFNGALTSTPGLAAAVDVTGSPLAPIGYGVAYPAGAVLAILLIHLLPALLRVDLAAEEEKYLKELSRAHPSVSNRTFEVENRSIAGKSLLELELGTMTSAVISRVKHEGKTFTPTGKTSLQLGDVVKVVGTESDLRKAEYLIGRPVEEEIALTEGFEIVWALVTNKAVVNESLSSLNLRAIYGATITRIRRSGIDLCARGSSTLRFGDKVVLACPRETLGEVMRLLGNEEKRLRETDFLPISAGIVIGILIGAVSIPFFGLFDFSLGLTGGVLASGLLLSRIGKTGPIIWTMSGSGNQLLRKLGLLMFLAAVGTQAGAHIAETLADEGFRLLLVGVVVSVLPMILATVVGHLVLRMNFLTLLGVVAGSMTSTPGLAAVDSKTETDAASLGYAAVYPIALVLMIVFSQLLSRL